MTFSNPANPALEAQSLLREYFLNEAINVNKEGDNTFCISGCVPKDIEEAYNIQSIVMAAAETTEKDPTFFVRFEQ
ncbi:MAG: hypothetical protein KDJ35_00760 [Alphaproteobacteria bacterium]|nr:hypothetical protein [Alphaproteobacteria bacterium]